MILLTSNQFQKDRVPFSTILKIRRDVISYDRVIGVPVSSALILFRMSVIIGL